MTEVRRGRNGLEDRSWEALARAAAMRESDEQAVLQQQLLTFSIQGDPYAIPVERVREIVRMRPITAVPRLPPEILGVISLRGEIVQLIDLRMRLGLEPAQPTRATRIVVLHGGDAGVTGILVDAVTDVLRVEETAMRPPPNGETEFVAALCEHDGHFVSLMHVDRVIDLGGE